MVILDSSSAWVAARRMVFANRDTMAAIAGVFFVLPMLVAVVVLPQPPLTAGMDQAAMIDAMTRFYTKAAPVFMAMSLPFFAGYLTLLVMLLDRDRPTVAAAIGIALKALPSFLVAQLLTSLVLSSMWVIAFSALGAVLPQAVALLASLLVMIYPQVRMVLIGPEMVARRLRNPIRAIIDGVARTRGHGLRIMLYIAPALTLFAVIFMVGIILATLIAAAVPQPDAQRLIVLAFGAMLFGLGYTYYAAIIASTYDQLGPLPGASEVSPSTPG